MKTEHKTSNLQELNAQWSHAPSLFVRSATAHISGIREFAFLAFIALAMTSATARGQAQFEEEFDDTEKPWQEIAIQLPAVPAHENLIPFETISATATQTFAIDAKSITAGADGVVRYTLVATSPSGAKSVSYEGIRCDSLERKLYAFGHADGTWSRSRRDRWESIPRHATNNHHATLASEYFCDGRAIAGSVSEIVQRLKWRQPLQQSS